MSTHTAAMAILYFILAVLLLTCLCLLRYLVMGLYRSVREIREDRAADEMGRRAVAAELEHAAEIGRHRTDPIPAVRTGDRDTGNVRLMR